MATNAPAIFYFLIPKCKKAFQFLTGSAKLKHLVRHLFLTVKQRRRTQAYA